MDKGRWHQIDRVFRLALMQEEDRDVLEVFLTAECRKDRDLRTMVDSLLEHDKQPIPMLDQPAFTSSQLPRPGDLIGPWKLGMPVGEGGSGVVFAADRIGDGEHRVAIKFLRLPICTSQARDRFDIECQVLARLHHPHIARLHQTGMSPRGVPYMVLEWVEGIPLGRWQGKARPGLEHRLELFQSICEAVAFAHHHSVIHRDLKPSNILVTSEDQPKLLDFGIARMLPRAGEDLSRLTRPHQQPMTPQYASPEQLRGHDVTLASDVYSLGLMLYELLTGRLPYQLESPICDEKHRLLSGELLIQKPSLITRRAAPGSLLPSDIPSDLDTLVLTALEPDLRHRFPTAQTLAEEIGRIRIGRGIRARPPGVGSLLRRFITTSR